MRRFAALLLIVLPVAGVLAGGAEYAPLPGAAFRTALKYEDRKDGVRLAPFELMRRPVTNAQFLAFVQTHPQWRRDRVARVFAALAGPKSAAPSATQLPLDSVYQLTAPLTDQQGRKFDWRARRDTPQVVSMFYTACQYICPLIVDSGKAVEKSLTPAERARIGLLLISMDPKRDTPQALASVAARRQLDPKRWTLARPAPADVRSIAGVLGIRYRELADGEFNHTSALVLLDRDGRIVTRTEKIGSAIDPEFVAAVRKVLLPATR